MIQSALILSLVLPVSEESTKPSVDYVVEVEIEDYFLHKDCKYLFFLINHWIISRPFQFSNRCSNFVTVLVVTVKMDKKECSSRPAAIEFTFVDLIFNGQ